VPRGTLRIWPLLETTTAVHAAYEIATASPRIAYMGAGVSANGDIARDLGIQHTGTYLESLFVLSKVLLDVRAAGVPNPMSWITNTIGDTDLYWRNARFVRSLGYEGALLIHPSQVEVANAVFGVTSEEVEEAKKLIEAMESGQRDGKGAITYKGIMIDEAHLETARAVVERAKDLLRDQPQK
jgi:citrate lyase subunit beta/citryl-CoA lyase